MTGVERLEEITSAERGALAAFLDAAPGAGLFQRLEWHDAIRATYGHRTLWFVARDAGGAFAAAFPVVDVRHPLLGRKLVALPYQFHSGAPVAADATTATALVEAALARARELGARHLEIRHHEPLPWLEPLGFVALDSGLVDTVRSLVRLAPEELEHGHRKSIDYGARRGLAVVETSTLEGLRAFRRLYRAEQRRFGTPQAGARLFESLDRHLRGRYRLLLAEHEGRTIAGLLMLDDGTSAFVRCTATTHPAARRLRAGQALYWRAMLAARDGGCRQFHFGVSARCDRGLIAFKQGWRGATRPVRVYGYALRAPPPAPGSYFDGYRLAKAIWRRLPLPLTDRLGQHVTRWIC